jgi:DDE superfamily endonuclease
LKPHLKRQWCIKAINAPFLWNMEDVLDLYSKPYDPQRPLICVDERPCYLIGDVIQPVPMQAGQAKREDFQYSKHGQCTLFMAFEPLTGQRWARVYSQRRAQEYMGFMQFVSQQFPQAHQIVVVQDNLNTHQPGSFYAHLEPSEAFKLAKRFEWHYTPKHASWLNMIELEFSALSKQCLDRRIAEVGGLEREVLAWVKDRNAARVGVSWQFSVGAAREKFARHYQDASKLA